MRGARRHTQPIFMPTPGRKVADRAPQCRCVLAAPSTISGPTSDLHSGARRSGERHPHCGEILKPSNVSVDHGNPTSRNGAHALDNLAVMCQTCNERKGPLTTCEYSALLTLMVNWPAPARQSVLRRLRAGGRFTHN